MPSGAPTPSAFSPATPASRPAETKPESRSASPSTTSTASAPQSLKSSTSRPWFLRRRLCENDLHTYTWTVVGSRTSYADIIKLDPDQGRFFNGAEDEQRAHVCVLGSEAKTKLFSGGWAVGETIRLNGIIFTVVGVLQPKMQESNDDINRTVYIPFNTMSDLKDTTYIDGIWIGYQRRLPEDRKNHPRDPRPPRTTSAPPITTPCTSPICARSFTSSRFSPSRCRCCFSLVGALTLGIAGIGLMNIMLVAVQQRTREIGVEKALGARKRHILIQFLAEALAITGVGGVGGIALAYLVSVMVGRITFYSAHRQER